MHRARGLLSRSGATVLVKPAGRNTLSSRACPSQRSAGISVQWLAPLGLFRFSLGVPLNTKHYDYNKTFGDETEVFQFSIGQAF